MEFFWIIFGVIMIGLEAAATGVGLLFIGLGALSVGIAVSADWISEDLISQIAWFFALSAIWTALLYKPFKSFLKKAPKDNFQNFIGEIATVENFPLKKGHKGEIRWSGTTMTAMLSDNAKEDLIAVGDNVEIIDVKGNMMIVKGK